MKYKIDHDLHIHSELSFCAGEERFLQTNERILKYAEEYNLKTICVTDHFWDEKVDGGPHDYGPSTFSHISSKLPLPQSKEIRFLFGCETELNKDLKLGLSEERMEKFDFIIIPTTHLHFPDETVYKKGRVIYISGSGADGDFNTELNPKNVGFPYPLCYNVLDEKELDLCVEKINENLPYLLTYKDECQIQEIKISGQKSKFFIRNEEYYYTRPVIETKRKIKSVTDITKLQGYVVSYSDTTFQTLVPLRGIAILEVDFKQS